jgi:hypothetical protein
MSSSLPLKARRHHWGGPSALVTRVAQELRCRVSTAGQKLWGFAKLNDQVAAIVRAFKAAGQPEALERWLRPIREAEADAPPPVLAPPLQLAAAEADAAEDVADKGYDLHGTRDAAAAEVRALDRELLAKAAYRRALVAKWSLV